MRNLLVLLSFFWFAAADTEVFHWIWTCDLNEERCVKSAVSSTQTTGSAIYTSLPVCRLTCGRYGGLWPKPTLHTVLARQLVQVHPDNFAFEVLKHGATLENFFSENRKIFLKNLESECGGHCSIPSETKVNIYITVETDDLKLTFKTNESYFLEVNTKGNEVTVKICSDNAFGARHALETLSQLVASYKTTTEEGMAGLVMVAGVRIHDKPVFAHRGLLLDSARNFLPINDIKRQIDGMSAAKMNVMHWHISDTQSFPFESRRVPQLSKFGAYSPDKVYRPQEVADLIKYAQIRGVKIVFEIDAPAHAGNGWQWGPDERLGNLAVCVNSRPWRQFCIQPPCGQLNPLNHNLYNVLGELYADVVELLPDSDLFHMGGDEVFIPCWNSTPEITNYLKKQGKVLTLDDFLDLWSLFQSLALNAYKQRAVNKDTSIVLWSSKLTNPNVIEKYLHKEKYIIQTWVPASASLPEDLLRLGYRLIISTKDAWYLDHGFWGSTQYHSWRKVYENVIPVDKNVLGGEVCMWGEYVDQNGLDVKVWPRAAAAAERLWSNPVTAAPKAESRFYGHRERLVRRGIRADALVPRWCLQNEGECV